MIQSPNSKTDIREPGRGTIDDVSCSPIDDSAYVNTQRQRAPYMFSYTQQDVGYTRPTCLHTAVLNVSVISVLSLFNIIFQ